MIYKNVYGLTLSKDSSISYDKVTASLKFVWIDISSKQSIIHWFLKLLLISSIDVLDFFTIVALIFRAFINLYYVLFDKLPILLIQCVVNIISKLNRNFNLININFVSMHSSKYFNYRLFIILIALIWFLFGNYFEYRFPDFFLKVISNDICRLIW
jgi:hypothetical protein